MLTTLEAGSRRTPASAVRWAPAAIVVLATVAAFLPGVFGEFVGWDDDQNFLQLPDYRGLGIRNLSWMFTTFHMGHYMPLTWVTLGLDYLLWGMDSRGYHVTSLALHTITAVVLLHVARRLLRAGLGKRVSDPASWIGAVGAALLFAVHPLRVESVVWLSERRDVLSGLFYVLTVMAYLRAVDREASAEGGVPETARRWYWAAIGFFLCAILSKVMVISLAVVLVILDVYPLGRLGGQVGWLTPTARRVWAEKVPFFILAVVASVVGFIALGSLLGTAPGLEQFDLVARLAVSAYGLTFYLVKTVWPVGLAPLYEMPRLLLLLSPSFVLSGIVVLVLGVTAVGGRRRWPALAAVVAAYVVTLVPVLGIVQNGPQISADRYSYLACLGWVLLAGAGLAWCAEQSVRVPARRAWAGAVLAAATGLVVVAVGLTARQSLVWHDSFSVWARVLAVDPDSARGHTGLAGAFFADGQVDKAEWHLIRALELDPLLPEALTSQAIVLGTSGRSAEAVDYARKAVRLRPIEPAFHRLLGDLLGVDGRPAEALGAFREAARLDPWSTQTRYAIAMKLAELGHRAEALVALAEADDLARSINPDDPENVRFAATVFTRLADPARARPLWDLYLARMATVAHPTDVQQAHMREGLRAFEQLDGKTVEPRRR